MFAVNVGVVGRPRVVDGDAAEAGQHAEVVDAFRAALGVTGDKGVLVGAGAVHPVQLARHSQPGLVETHHLGAGELVTHVGQQPVEAPRGPYCTGASTPAGASPRVRCPHTHSRSTSWCSVTSMRIGGRSNCWRRSTAVIGRPVSEHPQPVHGPGSCTTSCFGLATCRSVVPSWPCCPPGLRPVFLRNDLGFGAGLANPSDDGGLLELPESAANRASNSAIRVRARCNSARVSISSSRSETTSAASTSYDGRGRSFGTNRHYDPDTSTPDTARNPARYPQLGP